MVEQLDELYREVILDHFKNSSHRGQLLGAQIKAEGNNPLCGDEMTFFLKLDDGRVTKARFDGKGCAISQAAASILCEAVEGKTNFLRPAFVAASSSRTVISMLSRVVSIGC